MGFVMQTHLPSFPAEDCDKMEQMLSVISTELMPELDMLAKCRHPEAPKSEE